MESNAATAAAVSSVAEADPTLPTAAHHPIPNMVGRERSTLGHISNPHPGYNRGTYPYGLPPNYTPPVIRDDAGPFLPSPSKGSLLAILTRSKRIIENMLRETSTPTPRFPPRGRRPTHYLTQHHGTTSKPPNAANVSVRGRATPGSRGKGETRSHHRKI